MIAKLVCAGADSFRELYIPEEGELLVGVDGGTMKIIEAGLRPHLAIGDFDSGDLAFIARHAERLVIFPERKDYGDLELAVREIAPLKPEKVLVFNGTGGRLDHFLTAVNVLIRYSDLNIEILDGRNSIKIVAGSVEVPKSAYKYCSFFAVEEGTVISLSGFKYNLKEHRLAPYDNLCLSNEVEEAGLVRTNKKVLMVRTL